MPSRRAGTSVCYSFAVNIALQGHFPPHARRPAGYASNNRDCDDTDAAIHPDAAEICDEVDNDCDGDIDEDCTTSEQSELTGPDTRANARCGACGAPAPAMVPLMTLALVSLKFGWPRRRRG